MPARSKTTKSKAQAPKPQPVPAVIPEGDDKESVYVRRAIIVERLFGLVGQSVACKAFSPRKVEFLPASVDETASKASKRIASTLAALRIVEALENAEIVNSDIPRSNRQKKMNFKVVHEMAATLEGIGNVKIIVGERANKRVLHYCITANNARKKQP